MSSVTVVQNNKCPILNNKETYIVVEFHKVTVDKQLSREQLLLLVWGSEIAVLKQQRFILFSLKLRRGRYYRPPDSNRTCSHIASKHPDFYRFFINIQSQNG